MGTSAMQDDPMLRLQYYKETGQADEAKNYEAYLRETGQWKDSASPQLTPRMRQLRAAERLRLNANDKDMADAETRTPGTMFAGGVAALGRHIPGMEAVQAGARSAASHILPGPSQDYRTALNDIRGAEADNPMSGVIGLLGGGVASAAMPGSPAVSGAVYGGAQGLLAADPQSMGDRLTHTAVGAGIGGLLGKLIPSALTYGASKFKPTIDVQQLARDKVTSGVDAALYGAASKEGAGAAITPDVAKAFQNPLTKEYVGMVRNAPQFAGADEATVLREAYKLMSRDQGGHADFMARNGFDAARQLKADAIGSAKKELLAASGSMMPSHPIAVTAHAQAMRTGEAGQNASDVTQRILTGAHIRGDNLPLKSPAQFADDIKSMSKDEALAALDMMLGRMKEYRAGSINPLKAFGLVGNLAKGNKLAPYVALLQKQAGKTPGVTTKAITGAVTGLLQ